MVNLTVGEVLGAWLAVSLLSTAVFVCLCLAGRREDLDRGCAPVRNSDNPPHPLPEVPTQGSRD